MAPSAYFYDQSFLNLLPAFLYMTDLHLHALQALHKKPLTSEKTQETDIQEYKAQERVWEYSR